MLGILEFPVIPQPLWGIFIGNSRALVIASEAKQSLGILNSFLGILEFSVGILEFFFSSLLEILDFCSL